MKQRIVLVAIIAVLVVFNIVRSGGFDPHDDAQTVRSPTTDRRNTTAEANPVESRPAAQTIAAETETAGDMPADANPVTHSKPVTDAKPHIKEKPENTIAPVAVPVLSPEEVMLLVKKQEEEREEAKRRGYVFYEERFFSMKKVSSHQGIQQTVNWNYVPKDIESDSSVIARKQDYFTVNSETPLEYVFVEQLYEYTKYQYSLSCRVRGNGIVTLSRKDGKDPKEFSVESDAFETLVYALGNGDSFNTGIIPSISFEGNIQVESISLQQKEINNQRTICLGSIESISNVPDIKKSDYPDCYYTAKFAIKDILDGNPAPQRIQLLIPAFLNNEIDPLSVIMKKGDWIVSIRPFSLATREEQQIEQVDEIESHLLTPYILVAADPCDIPELTVSGIPILDGETYVSPFDNPVNPPLPDRFAEDSRNEIEKELAKVNRIIEQVEDEERINNEFQSAWNEKQKHYDSLNATTIWARERNSFFALPKEWDLIPSARMTEENADAIVELNRLFRLNGIQFVIQIVPDYRDIAALVLNPDFIKYGDQRSARAAKQLLERGVEAHYISDELVKKAFDYERLFFYPNNYHPDEGTTDVMTSLIARRLEMFGDLISKDLNPSLFTKEIRDTGSGKNLKWPKNVDVGAHVEDSNVQVPYVLYDNKILESNPASKVLIFGNSFIMEPMTGNAYISYLAPKILHTCSCCSMSGISALTALPHLFLTHPDKYFRDKKIAVLPISITHLTDGRYTLVDISKTDVFLKNSNKSAFIANLPIKSDESPMFPQSFDFSNPYLANYLPLRTSSVALSESRSKATFSIPDGIAPQKVRFSVQPLRNYGVSVLVNGKSCRLSSQANPKWEVLEFDIEETDKSITIELDLDNCSSRDVKVLIGNASLFG